MEATYSNRRLNSMVIFVHFVLIFSTDAGPPPKPHLRSGSGKSRACKLSSLIYLKFARLFANIIDMFAFLHFDTYIFSTCNASL